MQKSLNIILGIAILVLGSWALIKPSVTSKQELAPSPKTAVLKTNQTQENSPMPQDTKVKGNKQYKQAEQVTKAGKSYTAIIKTSVGDITVDLSKETKATTNNFVFLAQDHFYDGVI